MITKPWALGTTSLTSSPHRPMRMVSSSSSSRHWRRRNRSPSAPATPTKSTAPDVEWYLVYQILPPISRLCEPINGTSPGIIVEKLGLDSSKYNGVSFANVDEDDIVDFTPVSCLPDEQRQR